MSLPVVSILLPVYNSSKYLRAAMDSLLHQTFKDFELLVINDGSTDNSEEIIHSYSDSRIAYSRNEGNKGLIFTLNKGIALAKGRYIARMDADDICVEDRLQKQVNWLEKNLSTAVVGCHITFINTAGIATGEWKDDIETFTHSAIRQKMAWENCMAHPTVMMRSEIARQYRYHRNQKNTEDYDLWLRLLADGQLIEKVHEKLLLYRVHDNSITGSILRKSNPFFKQFHCKRRFLWNRITNLRWGLFETKVLFTAMHNCLMGIGKNIKAIIKN